MPVLDEHDEPTEPIRYADFSAFAPTTPDDKTLPDEGNILSPRPSTQPFSQQYAQSPRIIPNEPVDGVGNGATYPFLPPRPHGNRPAGSVPVQREAVKASRQGRKVQENLVPITVGMSFVAVQVLLLLRFILKLLSVSSDIAWVGATYTVSSVFVLPFRLLFLQLTIPLLYTVEMYTLLAILVYGIISRIIVRILKTLLSQWLH